MGKEDLDHYEDICETQGLGTFCGPSGLNKDYAFPKPTNPITVKDIRSDHIPEALKEELNRRPGTSIKRDICDSPQINPRQSENSKANTSLPVEIPDIKSTNDGTKPKVINQNSNPPTKKNLKLKNSANSAGNILELERREPGPV